MNVHVYGRSDHAGTTPIKMRADAMLAAAKAMTAATEKALEIGEGTVVTFGQVETVPAVFNIVAKEAFFTVDCRSKTLENVDAVLETIRKAGCIPATSPATMRTAITVSPEGSRT